MADYVTLDSGQRQDYDSGMRRDTQVGKPRYDLIDRPFLRRWAELMGRGAEKYGERNWELANSEEEVNRFKASAFRHLMQWLDGDETEDHAAAVAFNVAAAEMVKGKIQTPLGTWADYWQEELKADQELRQVVDENLDGWPAVGGKVYRHSPAPDLSGTYLDSGEDGYQATWRNSAGVWQFHCPGELWVDAEGSWGDIQEWEAIWPWERIS